MNTQQALEMVRQNPQAAQQAQEQLHGLLARSATDREFRQKLLTDPRAAVSEYTGKWVPETLNLVFVENKADATIVLPAAYDPSAELSDAELETVAGGEPLTIIAALLTVFVLGATL